MSNLIQLINNEIIILEKELKKINTFLDKAPEGCLKWQHKEENTYYYHQFQDKREQKWRRQYIKKDNISLAKALAQKHYYSLVKPVLEKNLNVLKRFTETYQQERLGELYDTLSDERKRLVSPVQLSVKERVKRWEEEEYTQNTMYHENLRFETEQGELVRSKSEVIIANMLHQYQEHILYKYEKPLNIMVDGTKKTIYPDFTIINVHTGRIIYWEHAGKMGDPNYANDFVKKVNAYITNDFLPGRDVIFTFETQGKPLNLKVVKKLIKDLCRRDFVV